MSVIGHGVEICTSTTRPSPSNGLIIFETDTKLMLFYDGSSWQRFHPAGSIVQTVSTTYSTPQVITATTPTTYFSAAITPRLTSSNVLVTLSLSWNKLEYYTGHCQVFRNGTNISPVTVGSASLRSRDFMTIRYWASGISAPTNVSYSTWSTSKSYMDSPASTSTQTYDVRFFTDNAGYPLYLNRSQDDTNDPSRDRGFSTITLSEILQ